jgi:hypothetical protein
MKGLTEIKIQAHLDAKWAKRFDGMTVQYVDNLTIMQIKIKDQAHLHGILNLILDLNLKLISVNTLEAG